MDRNPRACSSKEPLIVCGDSQSHLSESPSVPPEPIVVTKAIGDNAEAAATHHPPDSTSSNTTEELPISLTDLSFTGERFVPGSPDVSPETRAEHVLRYRMSAQLVAGLRVLDAACGTGYGSALLADYALSVDGIDIDPATIAYAATHYSAGGKCRYQVASVDRLPFQDSSFDVVVSFETIEHVNQQTQVRFLAEIRRILKPTGILVLSTPNKLNYSDRTGNKNPYHLHELYEEDFLSLLNEFELFALYRQSQLVLTTIWSNAPSAFVRTGEFAPLPEEDLYLIAVCGRENASEPDIDLSAVQYEPGLSYHLVRDNLKASSEQCEKLASWGNSLASWGKSLEEDLVRNLEYIDDLEKRLNASQGTCLALTTEVAALRNSLSWRITHPLRLFVIFCWNISTL